MKRLLVPFSLLVLALVVLLLYHSKHPVIGQCVVAILIAANLLMLRLICSRHDSQKVD